MSETSSARNEIFKDGFCYVTQKIAGRPPVRYLKCCMRKSVNCSATGKVPLRGGADDFVYIREGHNHAPSDEKQLKSEFMGLLKKMCLKHKSRVRNIYRAAAEIDEKGASVVPFQIVHTSMRKWAKQCTETDSGGLDFSADDEKRVRRKYRTRRASDIIFKDGFAYVNQKFTEDPPVRYLKCNMRNITRCPATGKVPLGGNVCDFVQIHAEHNHPPDRDFQSQTEFKDLLKKLCRERQFDDLKNIYLLAETMDPEGAKFVPYKSVQCSLWKWRKLNKRRDN